MSIFSSKKKLLREMKRSYLKNDLENAKRFLTKDEFVKDLSESSSSQADDCSEVNYCSSFEIEYQENETKSTNNIVETDTTKKDTMDRLSKLFQSDSTSNISSTSDYNTMKSTSRYSNKKDAKSEAILNSELKITKVESKDLTKTSLLTRMFKEDNYLAEKEGLVKYSVHGEKANSIMIKFKLLIEQHKKCVQFEIKENCSVEQTIGYSLYVHNKSGNEPLLSDDLYKVDVWCLRIIDDDGDIDDDFPALDNSTLIKNFKNEQLALCLK